LRHRRRADRPDHRSRLFLRNPAHPDGVRCGDHFRSARSGLRLPRRHRPRSRAEPRGRLHRRRHLPDHSVPLRPRGAGLQPAGRHGWEARMIILWSSWLVRTHWPAMLVAVVALVVAALFAQNRTLLDLSILIAIYSVMAISLGMLFGQAGVMSLGQAAFAALGAYTTGILTTRWELSPMI